MIELKLVQRKILGIANPNLVSVDEIRNKSTRNDLISVDVLMGRETVWLLARIASNAVVRTTLEKCAGPRDLTSLNLSQSVTQEGQRLMAGVPISVEYMR